MSYTCLACGMTSHNPHDEANRYCGRCHQFEDRELGAAAVRRLPTTRTCDGCDLCCTAASVTEIGKPAGVPCPHLTALAPPGRNCLIYKIRPRSCASFVCIWRASDRALDVTFRPADCGFALWINDPFVWPMVITVGPDPARPDAWDRPHFRRRFKELAFDLNCAVAIGQGVLATHIFAPSGKVYSKADRPDLFVEGGREIGLPAKDFRAGVRLSVEEIAVAILGFGR